MSKIDRNQAVVQGVIPEAVLSKCMVSHGQMSFDHRCNVIRIIGLASEYREQLLSMIRGRFFEAVAYDHGAKHPLWFDIAPHPHKFAKPWPKGFYEEICTIMHKKPQPDPRVAQGSRKSRQGSEGALSMR